MGRGCCVLVGHRPPKCPSQPRLRAREEQEGAGPSRTGSKQGRPEVKVQFPEQSWSGPGRHQAELVRWKARRQNWVRTQRSWSPGQVQPEERGSELRIRASGPGGMGSWLDAGGKLQDTPRPSRRETAILSGVLRAQARPQGLSDVPGEPNKSAHPHSSSQLNTLIISAL